MLTKVITSVGQCFSPDMTRGVVYVAAEDRFVSLVMRPGQATVVIVTNAAGGGVTGYFNDIDKAAALAAAEVLT